MMQRVKRNGDVERRCMVPDAKADVVCCAMNTALTCPLGLVPDAEGLRCQTPDWQLAPPQPPPDRFPPRPVECPPGAQSTKVRHALALAHT